MTNLEIPPCGPERDQLVAEAVGWKEVSDGLGGRLWVDATNKPTGYYTRNAMTRGSNPFCPSQSVASALAALEAWRMGNGICAYAVASPDPDDPEFCVCLWYSADGKSVADCEASAPTLRARVAELEAQLATAPAAPQSTPNGWKVGAETVELFKRSYDNVKHMTAEHDVAIRAALRERTPHLLRDLADGVSDGQLRLSLDRATGGSDNLGVALLRNCLRTLADTLEGEA